MALLPNGLAKTGVVAGFYPQTIDQSLRFNDADLPHLFWEPNDTPGGGGQKFTISFWMKRGDFGNQTVYAARTAALAQSYWLIGLTSDRLYIQGGYGANMNLTPNAAHRDPSAWYHVVVAADTTLATANDRVKLYINGEQVTDFSTRTNPSQNADLGVLSTTIDQYIGRQAAQQYFDGYLAEFIIVDNQQLAPTDFGETKSGIWIPKEYSGTYGEGTHLDFADSASIGNDISGNNHDWTVNNLVASDVVPDSPTNNFCTLNSVEFVNNSGFLSEGNLKISDTSSANLSASGGTIGMKSGKWYWEAHLIVQENGFNIGVVKDTESATSGTWNYTKTNFYAINGLGTSYVSDGAGAQNAAGTSFAQGDTVQVAYDADTGKLYFGKNGTWLNSADPAAGTGNLETTSDPEYGYHPATSTIGDASGYSDVIMNFGQDDTFAGNLTAVGNTDGNGIGSFKYTVPSGFLALCTSNLPDPAIDPAQDDVPEDYFNTVLYTGDSVNGRTVTGVGHQPDFVWIKNRSAAWDHVLVDSIRGGSAVLSSKDTDAEADPNPRGYLTSFDSDGFTLTSGSSGDEQVNDSGASYVSWNWKAGGTGVSNTDGSITSTVSANTDAGFSIVSYVGNATAGATVGHGLNSAPQMVIMKSRDALRNWYVLTDVIDGTDDYLFLNADNSKGNHSQSDALTSSIFKLGPEANHNANNEDYIAYCFHSVDGFSKVGSYTGNGSADGPFIYTGFRPKWVMIKRTDSSTGANWHIKDTERETYNQMYKSIYADLNNAENTTTTVHEMDFLSNGFKVRNNDSGANASASATYIFLAFAEQPFKYSNAR